MEEIKRRESRGDKLSEWERRRINCYTERGLELELREEMKEKEEGRTQVSLDIPMFSHLSSLCHSLSLAIRCWIQVRNKTALFNIMKMSKENKTGLLDQIDRTARFRRRRTIVPGSPTSSSTDGRVEGYTAGPSTQLAPAKSSRAPVGVENPEWC